MKPLSFAMALALMGTLDSAQSTIPNPLIDYATFQKIVDTSKSERESNRLTEDQFLAAMTDEHVVLLDARSASMY